jgi:hypothetical protein
MIQIIPRRPLDDDSPQGYRESDVDFVTNNLAACVGFLERGAPTPKDATTFTEAGVETAMCLWEAMLEIRDRPDIVPMFEDHGTAAIRHAVIALVPDCEAAWEADRAQGIERVPFDWEHCPHFLNMNLDRLEP